MAGLVRERPLLSPLMQRLLSGVANGKQLKEMANEQFVSYSTATNTIHEAKKRLRARHLAHAVIRAHGLGYLSHPTGPDLLVFPLLPE
jgi:DNA-binding NarL/FixJ family response regulator